MNMQILGVTLRRVTSRSLEGDFHHNEKLRREIWVNNGQYMISIDILDTIPYIYFFDWSACTFVKFERFVSTSC